jgi:hypothetical protein
MERILPIAGRSACQARRCAAASPAKQLALNSPARGSARQTNEGAHGMKTKTQGLAARLGAFICKPVRGSLLRSAAGLAVLAVLSGCAGIGAAPDALIDAKALRLLKPAMPGDCKPASDMPCAIQVEIVEVGKLDCKVKVTAGFEKVALGRATSDRGRIVVWKLSPPADKDGEYAFVDDVGVFPLKGQDPDETEFTKHIATGDKQIFVWISKPRRAAGAAKVEVSYNFLVTRTTGVRPNRQTRVCDNTDPIIFND